MRNGLNAEQSGTQLKPARTRALVIKGSVGRGYPAGLVNLVTIAPADAGEVVGMLNDVPKVTRINSPAAQQWAASSVAAQPTISSRPFSNSVARLR
ncbi:hypothetical protein [Blastomonas sp.]|uniref:hypothetical protein n=1 Tax=Blastomonas sp. TaxID=1909299 RepID=UPI0035945380